MIAAPISALAATAHDIGLPGDVSLDQPAYTVHENQGSLTITIVRSGVALTSEHVGYGVHAQDARPGINFDVVPNTYITMAPGQQTYSFQVPIIDQGVNATPVHALAYLYGAGPQPLGANSNSQITILRDDPLDARVATDPLGILNPVLGNPIAGAKLYVDPQSPAARAQRAYAKRNPAWSRLLGDIASAPAAHRFYMWKMGSGIEGRVARYLEGTQVREPGTTVMLSTDSLVHGKCGSTATPAVQARYDNFIHQVAQGVGNFHVIFFLELDSLITTPCLSHAETAIREAELSYAITSRESDPHVVVYLDAGAADAVPATPDGDVAAGLRGRPGAGLLPELHALRLDEHRDPLRPGDLRAARRHALRHQQRRGRSRAAASQASDDTGQRGSVQPGRSWPWGRSRCSTASPSPPSTPAPTASSGSTTQATVAAPASRARLQPPSSGPSTRSGWPGAGSTR